MVKYPTFQNASFCERLFEASLPNSGDSTGGLQIRSFFKSGPCGLKLHSNCSEELLLPVLWAHHRRSVLERKHFFSFYLRALIEILNMPFLIDIWGSQTVFLMVLFIHFELKVLPTAKTSVCTRRTCTDNHLLPPLQQDTSDALVLFPLQTLLPSPPKHRKVKTL